MNRNHGKWISLITASWLAMPDALPANCSANSPVSCGGGTGTTVKYCRIEYVPVPINKKGANIPIPLPIADFCAYEEKPGLVDSCTPGTSVNQKCGNKQKVDCTAKRKNTGPCCGVEAGKWEWDSTYSVTATLWTGTACEPRSGEK